MRQERTVDGHEAQILDQALQERKPIERIACCGLGFRNGQNVVMIDCNEMKSRALNKVGKHR
jgi:hypothetical protein